MELKGYCLLKSDKNVFIGLDPIIVHEQYEKVKASLYQPLRIIDIAVDKSGFLCIAPDCSCIIDIRDMSDVQAWFECGEVDNILCPPNLSDIGKIAWQMKWMNKVYNRYIRKLIIIKSFSLGRFDDSTLFNLSNDELKRMSDDVKMIEESLKNL